MPITERIKIKFSKEADEFIRGNSSTYRTDWDEAFIIPFIFCRDPEDDENGVYEEIPFSEITNDQLDKLGITNLRVVEPKK